MVRIAMHRGEQPATKLLIAKSEGISTHFIEQILQKLRAAGLVQSHRGTRGGFSLARDPGSITVREVLEATEGPLALAPCATARCARATQCVTRVLWEQATDALTNLFTSSTIGSLVEQARRHEATEATSFDI
jgi:Rrf2 family transcriptional regulator, cysteine metabolism repressor